MSQLRTIEIDFDIHKMIEAERRSFDESPNDVLRRLLNLGRLNSISPRSTTSNGKRSWSGDGVELSQGTRLRMEYNQRVYCGVIDDGEWLIENRRFPSPSAAASAIGLTKKGKTTNLDGWKYWYVQRPGEDNWLFLNSLRALGQLTPKQLGL